MAPVRRLHRDGARSEGSGAEDCRDTILNVVGGGAGIAGGVDRPADDDVVGAGEEGFFDVPQTVSSAVRQLARRGADFVTVHGNDAILEAACAVKDDLRILAVTVLTSLDEGDMRALGFETDIPSLVLSRARRALAVGCDGVISSGLEANRLRRELGDRLLIVVPGIRPAHNRPMDDQKRTMDVEQAFFAGADHIVVGRPIHGAADPRAAAHDIQNRIAAVFGA